MSKMKSTFACKGCERVFRSKHVVDKHERICPRLKLGKFDSFFNILGSEQQRAKVSAAPTVHHGEKILPLSQSLNLSNVSSSTNVVHSQTTGRGTAEGNDLSSADVRLQTTGGVTSGSHGQLQQTQVDRETVTCPVANRETQQKDNQDIPNGTVPQQTYNPPQQNFSQPGMTEDPNCPMCKIDVTDHVDGILCEMCKVWSHRVCLFMSLEEYDALNKSKSPWFCCTCQSIRSNN